MQPQDNIHNICLAWTRQCVCYMFSHENLGHGHPIGYSPPLLILHFTLNDHPYDQQQNRYMSSRAAGYHKMMNPTAFYCFLYHLTYISWSLPPFSFITVSTPNPFQFYKYSPFFLEATLSICLTTHLPSVTFCKNLLFMFPVLCFSEILAGPKESWDTLPSTNPLQPPWLR